MNKDHPRVTFGVPVFNGELFLAQTLESLLNQTFLNFEIVISDNASTDATEEICQSFAARDTRVRYYRNETNRGAAWNHNRVFELAKGELFKWNSADDLCAPEFLTHCVRALDANPNAVMACVQPREIDEAGNPLPAVSVPNQTLLAVVLPGMPTHVRFRQNIRLDHLCLSIYSLIRSEALRRSRLIGNYADSDRVLLAQLTLFGHCILVPEELFFSRDHPDRFTRRYNGERMRERAVWFDPSNTNRMVFPFWRETLELLQVVRTGPLVWTERLRCYGEIVRWVLSGPQMRMLYLDATHYPRKWIVRQFPKAKIVWNWLREEI